MNYRLGTLVIPKSMRGVLMLLVLVALLPLLVVQAGICIAWYHSRRGEETRANLEAATVMATTFEAFVSDVRYQEAIIGENLLDLNPYNPRKAGAKLAEDVRDPSILAWNWIDPSGKIVASSDGSVTNIDVSDRPYFQQVRDGQPWALSDILRERVTRSRTFVIAHRVDDKHGKLFGIVAAVIQIDGFGTHIVPSRPAGQRVISIFDSRGVLVYNSEKGSQGAENRRDSDPLLAVALDKHAPQLGVITLPGGHERYLAARIPIEKLSWVAGARRPLRAAMANVYDWLWIVGGVYLLVALGSGALALTTSGSLIGQLRRLQSHVEAIGRGNFGHVVDRTRVRELVELATAFNRMGTAVNEAQQALEAANAALEQRVRERTAELAATIVRLERTERELRTTSLYARGLLEAGLDPMVTISPEGKITDVNEATEGATGVPRQQLVGSDFSDYFTEPDKAREGYRKVLSEGLVRDYPLTIRHTSGRMIDVLYNAVVYRNESGAVQGVFAAARDVTRQRKAEEQLRQYRDHLEELVARRTKELEVANRQLTEEIAERKQTAEQLMRSNRELEQFAYVASHDLQEPLRVVTGYVQLLDRRYKDRLDADADQFIHYIVNGVTRMQQLITDLLNYSRIGTRGKAFKTTDMRKVLDRTLANLQKVVEESGATITCDGLPSVQGDEIQLVQLFQNLIGNGIKFRGERPAEINVSAHRDGDHWVFAVRDNGIGIERQYWDQIFVIFRRLHTRQKYAGTGIGLAICKRIVERHGGRIWLDSQPGQGTTFYFTLP